MTTISDTLNELYDALADSGYIIALGYYNIDDDEDMIMFALRYLIANMEHAFDVESEEE